MYEDIKRNKFKTGIIVSIFLVMITLIIYYICNAFGYSEYALIIALLFSIISTIVTYYNCDKVVLASVKAREANEEEDAQLNHILDGLMVASGLEKRPGLYVVDSMQPNAFATGRDPEHAIICVTKGLIEKLDYYELEGVIAHELSHIKNYDIRLSAVISVMVGFIVILADMFTRITFRSRKSSDNNEGNANGIIMIIGLICLIFSPIISQIIQMAVSRRREYLADATAVSFTRNPDGLVNALIKISSDDSELDVASGSTAHMYIVSPFTKKREIKKSNLFSTHPGIEERIEAIRKLS